MIRILLALALCACASLAHAAYPERPVTLVVPFPAGGPTDKLARDLAEVLRRHLDNQTVVIENVGGAGGTLGAAKVAKATADGYTLLLHHIGMATSPGLYRHLPYRTLEDFEYLGLVNEVPMAVIGRASLPARSYAELVVWLKANKGKINLAHAGLGAASHLCGLLLQQRLKIEMTSVRYKGTAPAMNDLIAGTVQVALDTVAVTRPYIEAGRLRLIAVGSLERLAFFPDTPTIVEQGYPGFEANVWLGMLLPAGTPKETVERLAIALSKIVRSPEIQKKFLAVGTLAKPSTSVEFAVFLKAEYARWGRAIAESGIKAD